MDDLVSIEGVKVVVKIGVIALAVAVFVYGQARYKVNRLLDEERAAEREAERALSEQPVPEPSPSMMGWEPVEQEAFERACEEWGFQNVVQAFADIYDLKEYWAEDWETVA